MNATMQRRAMDLRVGLCACLALITGILSTGCAGRPPMTKHIYEDRMLWVWLEENPYAQKEEGAQRLEKAPALSGAVIAAWMKGFRVLTERGIVGMTAGRDATTQAFVEQEMFALAPYLSKGLAMAKPNERVAYCFAVDRDGNERHITTAYLYIQQPYLYYRLEEYRTLIKVKSPIASTGEACQTKPIPGYRTADRYFRLEYEPDDFIVGYGTAQKVGSFMAGIVENRRGEVVFKLASILPDPKTLAPKTPPAPQQSPATLEPGLRTPQLTPAVNPTSLPTSSPTSPTLPVPASPNPVAQLKSAGDPSPSTAPAAQKKPSKRSKPKPSKDPGSTQ